MSLVKPPEGLRTLSDPVEGATRIVLVRHGQGFVNVEGRIGGQIGCSGLTDEGRSQVSALATRLESTGELQDATNLLASILPRAVQTAEILAPALGMTPEDILQECGLCELHPGEADNLIWEDYVERYGAPDWDADPSVPIAPGGESWVSFVDRVGSSLDDIVARFPGGRVVIATHAGFIESSLLRFLVGSPEGSAHRRLRLQTKHASMTEWEHSDIGWRLLRYNDATAVEERSSS